MQRWHFQFQGQKKQFWESLYFLDWLHHLFKSNKLDEINEGFAIETQICTFCNTGDISYYGLIKCYFILCVTE